MDSGHAVVSYIMVMVILCSGRTTVDGRKDPILVCYYTTWASQRAIPDARFSANDIDPNLCTHLILAFANIDTHRMTLVASDPRRDLNSKDRLGLYAVFNRLKIRNSRLLTMLSIGGINARSKKFVAVSKSPKTRMEFAENVVKFLRLHRFDGLDVDWEYPNSKDGSNKMFTSLLKSLMAAFRREEALTGNHRLRLSIAVGAGERFIKHSYEVDKISKTVDFINLMTYDFAGAGSIITSFNAPLYPRVTDRRFDPTLCQEWAVNSWIREGAPREILVLGIPANGKSFTLSRRNETGVGAGVTRAGVPGRYIQIGGVLAYFEICELTKVQAVEEWDDIQKVPYAHWGSQWIGYDNERSVTIKTEWMLNQTLAGVMVWTVDFDDFKGDFCDRGRFPLTQAIKRTMDKYINSKTTTPISTSRRKVTEKSESFNTTRTIDTRINSTTTTPIGTPRREVTGSSEPFNTTTAKNSSASPTYCRHRITDFTLVTFVVLSIYMYTNSVYIVY